MSIDERQHLDNGVIDLAELFRSVWFYKFSLLIFVVLTIPVYVWYSTSLEPTYKAITVFEKPTDTSNQSNSSTLNTAEVGLLSFLGGGEISAASDSFYSEIRSESFLKTVIYNNAALDTNMLRKFCPLPSKEIPRFSLRSLLVSLGISENGAPSESQKISLVVKCVNDMLEINFDSYGSSESSAYRLSIESGDSNFSANLANQIVEKYFVRHEKKRDQQFQKVKDYLSTVISEAQLEFTEAIKSIQSFIIKHTLLMNLKLSSAQNATTSLGVNTSIPGSPFAPELNKEIANLSQLEKSLSQLKQARLNLLSLKELDQERIKAFISSTEVQGVLSRTFVTSLAKIENLSAGTSVINEEIKKIVNKELQNLKQQIQALGEKIDKREEQTIQLMSIENRFQELAINVSKKKFIFEGLKDQLKEKILTSGLASIQQPILLTKAVPPFFKASPNKKQIVAMGVLLSTFFGIAYILIRQSFLRGIHSPSQLQNLSGFLSCYKIKYKQLELMGQKSGETVVSQSFFSRITDTGKLGCIIDLSQKKLNNSLSSEFSITIAGPLAANSSKIVCLNTPPNEKSFSIYSRKNFISKYNDLYAQGDSDSGIVMLNDENGLIGSGETTKIKNKYSDYDKIICALGAETSEITKFKFIENCDFYILIGRSFHFDEYTFKKFSNNVWEKEKKCLGFFLID